MNRIAILYSRREPAFLQILKLFLFYALLIPALWAASGDLFLKAILCCIGFIYACWKVSDSLKRGRDIMVFEDKEDAIDWICSLPAERDQDDVHLE